MSTRRKRGCKPLFFPPPPDVPPGGGYVVASFGPWVQGPGPGPGGPLSPAPHPSQRPGAEAGTLKVCSPGRAGEHAAQGSVVVR